MRRNTHHSAIILGLVVLLLTLTFGAMSMPVSGEMKSDGEVRNIDNGTIGAATDVDTQPQAVEVIYDTDFLPNNDSKIKLNVTMTVPETMLDSRDREVISINFEGKSVNTTKLRGFSEEEQGIVHDGRTKTATAEVWWDPTVENWRFEGADFGAGEEWAFVDMPIEKSVPGNTIKEQFKPTGFRGEEWVLLGDYDRYSYNGHGQNITLIVPDTADMVEEPNAIVESLAYESRHLRVDNRNDRLYVFATTDPIRSGGVASWNNLEVWASDHRSLSENTWGHEYVHTRQDYSQETNADWLSEAEATYYQHLLAYKQEDLMLPWWADTQFEAFQHQLSVDGDHDNVSLADPDTWESRSDYDKGALVLAALDAEIREQTDGERCYQDVFRKLNQQFRVGHDDFATAVEEVVGKPKDEFMDRYVLGTDVPSVPDDPSLYTQGEHEFDVDVDATIAGNDQMTMTPGKPLEVPLVIENNGTDAAVNIAGTLSVADQEVQKQFANELGPDEQLTDEITLVGPKDDLSDFETATLNITDANGTKINKSLPIRINDHPTLTVNSPEEPVIANVWEDTVLPASVAMNATVSNEIGTTTVTWELSGLTTVSGLEIERDFDPGKHNITVTAEDEYGGKDTESISVVVTDQPSLNVDVPDEAVRPEERISLTADIDNNIGDTKIMWEFPDDTTINDTETVTQDFKTGEHEITITVEDEYGAETMETVTITVEEEGFIDSMPGFGVSVTAVAVFVGSLLIARSRR